NPLRAGPSVRTHCCIPTTTKKKIEVSIPSEPAPPCAPDDLDPHAQEEEGGLQSPPSRPLRAHNATKTSQHTHVHCFTPHPAAPSSSLSPPPSASFLFTIPSAPAPPSTPVICLPPPQEILSFQSPPSRPLRAHASRPPH